MRITMITPAPPRSRAGNRATAVRWARFLEELGHHVTIATDYRGGSCDAMLALHAWRSAASIERFAQDHPRRPLMVALTGTDLYRFIDSHPEPTLRSIDLAWRLITLHALAHRAVPVSAWPKIQVIYQSAEPLKRRLPPRKGRFDICVVGHLREEKDPLRAALAVRDLPDESQLAVQHYGKAHNEEWAGRAQREMDTNPRYHWYGELPHWKVRQAYARSRAMVLSSRMEGGANVISEAVVAGLPVIASEIPGSVGLLGTDYAGYYVVEDTKALRATLLRAEKDTAFLERLRRHGKDRAHLFTPEQEREGLRKLLAGL